MKKDLNKIFEKLLNDLIEARALSSSFLAIWSLIFQLLSEEDKIKLIHNFEKELKLAKDK